MSMPGRTRTAEMELKQRRQGAAGEPTHLTWKKVNTLKEKDNGALSVWLE
jgi:hypothetical protein